jgi:hypothetical protein
MIACMDKIVGRIIGRLDSPLVNDPPLNNSK